MLDAGFVRCRRTGRQTCRAAGRRRAGRLCARRGWCRRGLARGAAPILVAVAVVAPDAAPAVGRAGSVAALEPPAAGVRGVAVTGMFAGAVVSGATLPLPLPFPIPDSPFPAPTATRSGLPARSNSTSRPRSSLAAGVSSPTRKAWVSSGCSSDTLPTGKPAGNRPPRPEVTISSPTCTPALSGMSRSSRRSPRP